MRRRRGYSLMELVMVLVISGILAAIVIPQFNPRETDASWFYEQVKAAVRYAQRQAVAQRRTVYVVVDATTVKLCYYDASCATPVSDFGKAGSYLLTAPSGVALAPTTFSFNGLGQTAGTTFSVGAFPVTVVAETGYVP